MVKFSEILKRALHSDVLNQSFLMLPEKEQELVLEAMYKPIATFGDLIDLNFSYYMTRDIFPFELDTLLDRHFQMFMENEPDSPGGVAW
jgi:hypothetical protein